MGWADLLSFSTHPAFRLVAIADVDQTRAEQALAKFPGVRVYQDWRELLEREKKLLDKIDQALERLARGEYGWCAETGEPIGLRRLLLRPTATLCIEAKERQEQREKHQRDRD